MYHPITKAFEILLIQQVIFVKSLEQIELIAYLSGSDFPSDAQTKVRVKKSLNLTALLFKIFLPKGIKGK